MEHQDWSPLTINTKNTKNTKNLQPSSRVSDAVHAIRKIETSDSGKLKMLTSKSRAEMAQTRVAKGMTQKLLDQRCQFPANSCNGWEAGKTCPSGPQLNILHRILGIKLERE